MIKKYPYFWSALVVVLILLNLWKWLPSFKTSGSAFAKQGNSTGLVLDFPSPSGDEEKAVHRDLFALGEAASAPRERRSTVKAAAPAPVLAAATPLATPTPMNEVAGGYRLMGVVFREGKSQALLGKGDQLLQLMVGDEIETRYRVESISDNEVDLTDKQTGNSLKLLIWDK